MMRLRFLLTVTAMTGIAVAGRTAGDALRAGDRARRKIARTADVGKAMTPIETVQAHTAAHRSLGDAIEFARNSREALRQVDDYTAVFSKTELVGRRYIEQTMQLKLREQPFSVYLRFVSKRQKGREVIFVAGANDG